MVFKINFFKDLLTTTLSAFICFSTIAQTNWISPFNGKNLKGWEVKQGSANFEVINNTIVATTLLGSKSTYLATKKQYGDFILEAEMYATPGLNSGIQFRSHAGKKGVYGYQCEFDTDPIRAWTGGIFDQSRRSWIYPLTENREGSVAFKNGHWNKVRIEAIGNKIQTFINGVQCANLVDDMDSAGFIALQLHSIKSADQVGKKVKWRNIRISTENVKKYQSPTQVNAKEISYLKNTLTEDQVKKGWRLLWDGKTSDGWKSAKKADFPEKGWVMKDGILTVLESGGGEARNGGDIVTIDKFSNFELEVDFMFTPGANSGIKYFVDTTLNQGVGSSIGCEFQILDDNLHPDAKKGVKSNRTLGSLYDLIRSESLQEPRDRNQRRGVKPNGWNRAKVLVKAGKVEHWLNNMKIVEYDRYSQMFKYLVYYSKYSKYENFGRADEGRILLQDHGNTVSFKNIKIREF